MTAALVGSGITLNLPSNSWLSDQQTADEVNSLIYAINILLRQYQQDHRVIAVASEALVAGAAVSLWNNAGVLSVRNANATDNTKVAIGFVEKAVATGTPVEILCGGLNIYKSGLTIGAIYYLDTANGAISNVKPSGAGKIVQPVGIALTGSQLFWNGNLNFIQL